MAASLEQLKTPILAGRNENVQTQFVECAEVYSVGQGMDYISKIDAIDEVSLIEERQAKIDLIQVGPGPLGGSLISSCRHERWLPLVTLPRHSGDWRRICDANP